MFRLFRKRKQYKQLEKSVQAFQALWDIDYDEVWEIETEDSFLTAITGNVCRKCDYGDEIEKLTYAERVFFVSTQLEGEVNNGGFSQFFYNSSGNYSNEVANSLREIGANKTAEIYDRVLHALGCSIPENRNEREKILDALPDSVWGMLNECDNEFYNSSEKLAELYYQFIIRNRAQFTHA